MNNTFFAKVAILIPHHVIAVEDSVHHPGRCGGRSRRKRALDALVFVTGPVLNILHGEVGDVDDAVREGGHFTNDSNPFVLAHCPPFTMTCITGVSYVGGGADMFFAESIRIVHGIDNDGFELVFPLAYLKTGIEKLLPAIDRSGKDFQFAQSWFTLQEQSIGKFTR